MYFHAFPTKKKELSIANLSLPEGLSPDETPGESNRIHQVTLL